jgi:hypothetical protein
MNYLECIPTEDERKEIVQDVIDRLMYLPSKDRGVFMSELDKLFFEFEIKSQVIDGIRIYGANVRTAR